MLLTHNLMPIESEDRTIYISFTEGFDAADLTEARALLVEHCQKPKT